AGMGFEPEQYTHGCKNVHFESNQVCYHQDIVVQIRAPEDDELSRLQPGSLLLAMLHYPSHPTRNKLLAQLGLHAISMDSVVNDSGRRLIENLHGTSWNAIWAGFQALRKNYPAFDTPNRRPLRVVIMGHGAVGSLAVDAALKYGDEELSRDFLARGISGVLVEVIGRNITANYGALREVLREADMLVDATFRSNPTQYIIPNELVGVLPAHAVIVDITADPYIEGAEMTQVKGIEGIPSGNLDEYEFRSDHPAFDQLPPAVQVQHRRRTISCYSWPGLKPVECMQRYGQQLAPMFRALAKVPYQALSPESADYLERALYRGTLRHYELNL
ncbi:MAG: alanine dehydrogenase, partial [Chloroflexota bacterium]|nr:alanine dehydrogenase [Chloroflexota bacterium]